MAALLGAQSALPIWNAGLLPWKPHLAAAAEDLRVRLAGADPVMFAKAVQAESRRRMAQFLRGVDIYRHHPFRRTLTDPPTVWHSGTTRLLDYGQAGGLPVLLIPSLVNRAYILDLSKRRSLARFLAARGLRPYLVDWAMPGDAEAAFTLDDYIARLEAALDLVAAVNGRPAALVGYCMGGLLALAVAARRPAQVGGLALLATPWEFGTDSGDPGRAVRLFEEHVGRAIDRMGHLPVDALQALFTAFDPTLVERKFRTLAELAPGSARARDFVTLEDWLNDGVPLVGAVARECLLGWYGRNSAARGEWRVAGTPVIPEQVDIAALVMVPRSDRIVPPESALALAARLPRARRRMVPAGHIGMIAGRRALTDVYWPLAKWLGGCCAAP